MRTPTKKDLRIICRNINNMTGNPVEPRVADEETGKTVSAVGHYFIDGAHGGWALYQIVNEYGACTDVFRCGHVKAGLLYNMLHAFITGYETRKHESEN